MVEKIVVMGGQVNIAEGNATINATQNNDKTSHKEHSEKDLLDSHNCEFCLDEIISEYKSRMENETILPWVKNTILDNAHLSYIAVFPNLFIMPNLKSIKLNNLINDNENSTDVQLKHLIKTNQKQNIIITGDAGIGKSTLFKHVFLRQEILCSDIQDAPQFYYLKATEYANFDANNNGNKNQLSKSEELIRQYIMYVKGLLDNGITGNNAIILLDCIDEAYPNNPQDLKKLIGNIQNTSNIHVWLGWRQEHLKKNRTADLNHKMADEIVICEWDLAMANNYVETYSRILKKQHIADRYNEIKNNHNISDFSKNPFQLTLLLFLMEFPCEINDTWNSISLYKLYNLFIELWIKKENKQTDTNEILHTLIFASKELYYGIESKVTDNRPVIRDLFHFSYKENTVTEFCHRSLAAFFLAKNILDLITGDKTNNDLEHELQKELNNDVTQFIRSAVDSYEDDVILSIQKKLQNLYFQVSIREKSGTQSPEEYINCLSVKNGIVYLTTRLRNVDNIATNFLQAISGSETDIRMKVTISYGAAKLGLQDVAKKFAEEYYCDNSELEEATRSFSLVYYRDVIPKYPQGLYTYHDDGEVSWENSRVIRLENLLSDKKQDIDLRILDVPLLYCFYKSRKWKDVNLNDYNQYINSVKIDKASYTEEVYDFLNEKVKLLKEEYFKALFQMAKH